jgi:chemotaxis protein methyltransferase CheR
MTGQVFSRIAEFVYRECGIKLPPAKKTMVEARIQKRLRLLDLPDFTAYSDYLFQTGALDVELPNLIDAVTTNTTEFFREAHHFEFLQQSLLPRIAQDRGLDEPVTFWSAGCSSGEEPYSIAMVLREAAENRPGLRFDILATDISVAILNKAVKAIYHEERTQGVPQKYRRRYLLRSKDREAKLMRIAPEIRSLVRFERLNFMEEFGFDRPKDVIFCRNVIIYFDRDTQENLLARLCRVLARGGHLFIGHSESLAGMRLPLRQVAPTVYRRN